MVEPSSSLLMFSATASSCFHHFPVFFCCFLSCLNHHPVWLLLLCRLAFIVFLLVFCYLFILFSFCIGFAPLLQTSFQILVFLVFVWCLRLLLTTGFVFCADDILDEYLAPPKKPEAVTQLPIPEEGFMDEWVWFIVSWHVKLVLNSQCLFIRLKIRLFGLKCKLLSFSDICVFSFICFSRHLCFCLSLSLPVSLPACLLSLFLPPPPPPPLHLCPFCYLFQSLLSCVGRTSILEFLCRKS